MKKLGIALVIFTLAFGRPGISRADTFQIAYTSTDTTNTILNATVEATASGSGYLITSIDSFHFSSTFAGVNLTLATLAPNYDFKGSEMLYPNNGYTGMVNDGGVDVYYADSVDWQGLLFNVGGGHYVGLDLSATASDTVVYQAEYYYY